MVYMYLIFTQNFIHTQMMSKLGLNRLINFLTNFLVSPKESEEVRRKQKTPVTHHKAYSRQIRHHIDRSHHTGRCLADTDCWHI